MTSISPEKELIRGNRRARRLALQALYQWQLAGGILTEIEAQYCASKSMDKVNIIHFRHLLHDIPKNLQIIECEFLPLLDRPIEQINPIELTILRICTYELLYNLEIPYRVILDESIALNREFGSSEGHRFVNGILHHVAKKIRTSES